VTFQCSLRIPSGRLSSVLIITLGGILQAIFPFRDLRFGTSVSSALNMSAFVMVNSVGGLF